MTFWQSIRVVDAACCSIARHVEGLRRAMETLTEKPKDEGKVLKIANA